MKNDTNTPPGVARRPYNIKRGRHIFAYIIYQAYVVDERGCHILLL